MKEVVFTPSVYVCPSCGTRLRAYRTDRRIVKSSSCQFVALHRLKICMKDGKILRSDTLGKYVRPHCTYANDITLISATNRFIDGRSCSDIASSMGIGISERHVGRISNNAMDAFVEIHEESLGKIKSLMKSYVLQIDLRNIDLHEPLRNFSNRIICNFGLSGFRTLELKRIMNLNMPSILKDS